MRFGTVRSPTPISRRLSSISSQKRSNSAWDSAAPSASRLQPPQHHPQMQHQQIKTAVNRVRHGQVPIKQRFSRLRHDHAIDGLDGAARGDPGFPEVIERPKHCGFRKRAAQRFAVGRPRLLQSDVLPGTSTPRPMQGDGTSSGMTETSPTRSRMRSLRGLRAARWRGLRAAAAVALACVDARRLPDRRAVPEGLYPAARRARANSDRGQPGPGADRDGNALHGRDPQRRGVLLHFAALRAPGRCS